MTTAAYRSAVDTAWSYLNEGSVQDRSECNVDETTLNNLRQIFSRGQDGNSLGLTPGFLKGVAHQELVRGRSPRHRGLFAGKVVEVNHQKKSFEVILGCSVKRGDGLVIDRGEAEKDEEGGSVFDIYLLNTGGRRRVSQAMKGDLVEIHLGPHSPNTSMINEGNIVWKNKDPALISKLRSTYETMSATERRRVPLDVTIHCTVGKPLQVVMRNTMGESFSGYTSCDVDIATRKPVTEEDMKKAVGINLGDEASFTMGRFEVDYSDSKTKNKLFIPMKEIKEARRAALKDLLENQESSQIENTSLPDVDNVINSMLQEIEEKTAVNSDSTLPRLRVLCRTPEQVEAACQVEWLEEVILDFLEVKGLKASCEKVRAAGKRVIAATPRIIKPEEKHLWLFYLKLGVDALLVRGTGIIHRYMSMGGPGAIVEEASNNPIPVLEGDFSLNASNVITASKLLDSGLDLLAPTYDCNAQQINSLIRGLGSRRDKIEVIVHANLPVFHTEHCVYARFLSDGNSYLDCGRPCEHHTIHIRDPSGKDHLVEADMGCRNTVFEGTMQTAIDYLSNFTESGTRCYRIELVDQPAHVIPQLLEGYRRIITTGATDCKFWDWLERLPDANGRSHGISPGSFVVRQERSKSTMKPTASSSNREFGAL